MADDGSLVGLEQDYSTLRKKGKDDSDLFLLHLNQLMGPWVVWGESDSFGRIRA